MTTTFLSPPPHLLPSSTSHLLNSTALWHPSGQNTSSTPHLLTSSIPPLSGTPSGQNTSSTPHLLNSTASGTPVDKIPLHLLNFAALWYSQWTKYILNSSPSHLLNSTTLWYPQWTKYLLSSSTPLLSGAPSGPHSALGRPKWPPCSLAPQVVLSNPLVALSGASRGSLLCSLAPLTETPTKNPIIYY